MTLFGNTHKKKIDEVVEVVLVKCNILDIQWQQKSEVLYTFTLNKFFAYLLNVQPCNLVFLKTYNTEFDVVITTFTGQNGRPFKIEDEVNLSLFVNK